MGIDTTFSELIPFETWVLFSENMKNPDKLLIDKVKTLKTLTEKYDRVPVIDNELEILDVDGEIYITKTWGDSDSRSLANDSSKHLKESNENRRNRSRFTVLTREGLLYILENHSYGYLTAHTRNDFIGVIKNTHPEVWHTDEGKARFNENIESFLAFQNKGVVDDFIHSIITEEVAKKFAILWEL